VEEEEDTSPSSMTRAQWAAIVLLVTFAGIPLLSMVVSSGERSSGLTLPMVLGVVGFFGLVAVGFVAVRSAIRSRLGGPSDGDDPWD
jgi:hypothetical protein